MSNTRDTRRDSPQAKGPDEDRDTPLSGTAEVQRAARALGAPGAPEHEAFDDAAETDAVFNPFRYQANTVPPGLRAELIAAEPAPAPADRWNETIPNPVAPHVGTTPDAGATIDISAALDSVATAHDERSAPTLIIRRRRGKGSRAWVIALVVAAVLCATALAMRLASQPGAPESDATEVAARPNDRAALKPQAPPTAATVRIDRTKPALPARAPSAARGPVLDERAGSAEASRARAPEKKSAPLPRPERGRDVATDPPRPKPAAKSTGADIFEKPFKPPSD
jgi:hypothetical protein